jgi:hypothetical protein
MAKRKSAKSKTSKAAKPKREKKPKAAKAVSAPANVAAAPAAPPRTPVASRRRPPAPPGKNPPPMTYLSASTPPPIPRLAGKGAGRLFGVRIYDNTGQRHFVAVQATSAAAAEAEVRRLSEQRSDDDYAFDGVAIDPPTDRVITVRITPVRYMSRRRQDAWGTDEVRLLAHAEGQLLYSNSRAPFPIEPGAAGAHTLTPDVGAHSVLLSVLENEPIRIASEAWEVDRLSSDDLLGRTLAFRDWAPQWESPDGAEYTDVAGEVDGLIFYEFTYRIEAV